MRRIWRKIRDKLKDRIEQRITGAGYAFVATILLTGTGAFVSGNNLIFLITSALMSTLLISGLINRLSLSGLEVEFHPPEHLFAGEQAMAQLVIRNEKQWMPCFSTRLQSIHADGITQPIYFAMIGGGESVTEYAPVRFSRRGRFRDNSLEFTSRFPFGFAERRARVTLLADVLVYPALDPQARAQDFLEHVRGVRLARGAGHGEEFHRLRPYQPSDAAKRIDWRSSARHSELHVRENTRDETSSVTIVLDLLRGEESAEWFEAALRSVAWMVVELDRENIPVTFITQQRAIATPNGGDIYTILRYLAVVEPIFLDAEDGLERLIPNDDGGQLLVLTPSPARLGGSRNRL
ncbi:MAG: DUF58 domain-containing protein [Acidobacteria bacterium]|nr:DUF58 domain-containing protein [Acidobacteriota bacterium]